MLAKHIGQWLWHVMGGSDTEIFYTLLVFTGVLLSVKFAQWFKYNRTLPPGPWGVPIWGYLPFVKGATHLHFNELAKKYGSIFSIRLGSELIVVLSDYRIIRDSFRREEFSGRPHTDFMNILDGYGKCRAHSNQYILSCDFSTPSYHRGGLKHSVDSLVFRAIPHFIGFIGSFFARCQYTGIYAD